MKANYIFMIVGLLVVAFIGLINYEPTPAKINVSEFQSKKPTIITITKNKPVEIQIFDGENKAKFFFFFLADNTPYICHYNKGMPNEYRLDVPAYKDRELLGYEPNLSKTGFIKVELTLSEEAPVDTAQLYYIIKRIQ